MIVAGPEGFRKKDYRKFNIRSADLTPGDDFGMMREVLQRRFKRLIAEAPRPSSADLALAAAAVVPDGAVPPGETAIFHTGRRGRRIAVAGSRAD